MNTHFLDSYSLGVLFLLTLAMLLVSIEIGFLVGRRWHRSVAKAQTSQVRAIMGAALGLLAFMMAFTFATAQSHYETRVEYMLEEARLANNAFLQAEFLDEPLSTEMRLALRDYIGERLRLTQLVRAGEFEAAGRLIEDSETAQLELWRMVTEHRARAKEDGAGGAFQTQLMTSVIGLIDMHAARLEAALMNRIPDVIWIALGFMGMLGMLVMGYQAALVSARSPIATYALAVSFTVVLMLIIDLDRPVTSLFPIDNQVVIDLAERMDKLLEASPPGGRP